MSGIYHLKKLSRTCKLIQVIQFYKPHAPQTLYNELNVELPRGGGGGTPSVVMFAVYNTTSIASIFMFPVFEYTVN